MMELELLKFFKEQYNPRNKKQWVGDDCALFSQQRSKENPWIVTIDTLVEGRHYHRSTSPELIGRKLLAVSLSDIASMGGKPKYVLISLALSTHDPKWVRRLYQGMNPLIDKYDLAILGGDVVGANETVLSSVVIGEQKKESFFRKGAKNGDFLLATGAFGYSYPTKHHLTFEPRLKECSWLKKRLKIHSMTDASDGLWRSIELLVLDQNLGVDLDLDQLEIRGAKKKGKRAFERALFDGEDFELLFTTPSIDSKLLDRFEKNFHIPLRILGKINKKREVSFLWKGKPYELKGKPFEHFTK